MNKVFVELVKSKIEKFVDAYSLSRQIFVNENGKLKHPGEFGTYREKIVKSLIEPFLPTRLAVGTGFIIAGTGKGHTSTQCDLIIYDKDTTPVIENEEQRFFPIESVVGVIEVKSSLTKTELKNALVKLSDVKKLRSEVSTKIFKYSFRENRKKEFNHEWLSDQIATFLICEKIKGFNFETKDINEFFADTYGSIDNYLRHNMILSVKDGCLMYRDIEDGKLDDAPYKSSNYSLDASSSDYKHITTFLNYFYMHINLVSVLYPDLGVYLGII